MMVINVILIRDTKSILINEEFVVIEFLYNVYFLASFVFDTIRKLFHYFPILTEEFWNIPILHS